MYCISYFLAPIFCILFQYICISKYKSLINIRWRYCFIARRSPPLRPPLPPSPSPSPPGS